MIDYKRIPRSTVEGLLRYIDHGIAPGSYLSAVLENNLRGACSSGDDENLAALPDLVALIWNELPPVACWSRERVDKWIGGGYAAYHPLPATAIRALVSKSDEAA